ncbi:MULTISPECIES: alpha/beta hydrolase [unclassified Leifsonia]|uniref:alpha/beta hydrolase n=1 Tax=unclassified Leifsonia TaxID=2663824 RepID=UPI0006F21209|nr:MULTISPECIES: alpha/beta hydrolase [unclassified Leifsonia]KQX05704.1 peptidase [Leifsonia sp. Root1293]KRA09340.1 peptidase [Leifsonia sp. Root60]
MRAAVAGATLLALALTGCVPWAGGGAGPHTSTPTGETAPAGLESYYGQQLEWEDCGDGFQCTTATAPLDYRAPGDESIDLALVRHPATGDRLGSLLVNPGGPGGSGYEMVRDSLDFAVSADLQKHYDIIGFDPRGVSRSTPVTCYEPAQMDAYLYDITPGERGSDAWLAAKTARGEAFAEACDSNTGPLLDNVDTESAARDLDLLRAALGDSTLNYLGYSYGTYLGAVYAGLFPTKAGRLVLDGAIDPSATNLDVNIEQAKGFESALRAYLTDCLDGADCPFDGTVDDAMGTVKALLDSVDAAPIRATDGRMLGGDSLVTAIIYPLYSQQGWPALSTMFDSVLSGSADQAMSFADQYNGRDESGNYSDNSTEAFTAVNCMDYSYVTDAAAMREQEQELDAAAPVIGAYFGFGDITCTTWPYTSRTDRTTISAEGSPLIVVIGTTNDPATPYVWAQSLAAQLDDGRLVTYNGEGHTAYNKSNSCVNDAVDTFLIEGIAPTSDPDC